MWIGAVDCVSCFDPSQPNYQYSPDMYESVGYDTYASAFNGTAAQLPVEGSIPRGWQPYDYPNTNEGYELAKRTPHPLKNRNIVPKEKNSMRFIAQYVMVLKVMDRDFNEAWKVFGIPSYADRESRKAACIMY